MSQGSLVVQMLERRYSERIDRRSCASSPPLIDVNVSIRPAPARPPHTDVQHATDALTSNPSGQVQGSIAQLDCSAQHSHPLVPLAQVHR